MSRSDTWMPLYIGDYLRDTGHLTTAEHGAYLLLLMQAWTRNGALPVDDERLRMLARLDPKAWKNSRDTLLAFFGVVDGAYRHKRLDRELGNADNITEQRRAAGRASAEARAKQRSGNGGGGESGNGTGNGSSTPVATGAAANGQQTARPSQPQPQEKSSEATASGVAAATAGPAQPPPDARTALFREGLDRLIRLTGKPPNGCRSLLAKLLQAAGDDAAMVGLVLAEGESLRPADPVPWITAAVQARMGRRAPVAHGPPSKLAGWHDVLSGQKASRFDFDGTAEELPH